MERGVIMNRYYLIRSRRLLLVGFTIVLSMVAYQCLAAASPNTYAYLTCPDGNIQQYQVLPNGKFRPLTPASVSVRGFSSPIVVHPSKQFAYAVTGGYVYQFKIGANGALSLAKEMLIATNNKEAMSISLESTGRFAYVSLNAGDDNGEVAGFRVNADGTLSRLDPFAAPVGTNAGELVAHPARPFLYVLNVSDGSASQFAINHDGTLSPLKQPFVNAGSRPHNIAFSKDGQYAYIVTGDEPVVELYEVSADGSLVHKNGVGYGGEYMGLSFSPTIAAGDSGRVFVSDIGAEVVAELKTSGGKLSLERQYWMTRDNKAEPANEIIRRVRAERVSPGKRPLSADQFPNDLSTRNEEANACQDIIGRPQTLALGPGGMLYVVNSSGVAQLKADYANTSALKSTSKSNAKSTSKASNTGSLSSQEPALIWPDMVEGNRIYMQKAYPKEGATAPVKATGKIESPFMHCPRGITFVIR
jgi:hypothetical protein